MHSGIVTHPWSCWGGRMCLTGCVACLSWEASSLMPKCKICIGANPILCPSITSAKLAPSLSLELSTASHSLLPNTNHIPLSKNTRSEWHSWGVPLLSAIPGMEPHLTNALNTLLLLAFFWWLVWIQQRQFVGLCTRLNSRCVTWNISKG